MGKAKDIIVKPISAKDGNRIIKDLHYSGKVVNNSQLHLGVFLDGRCGGALQFGPSLDKRKIMGLVKGTGWNEFIELNRLALADWLPRNGESRAISVSIRLLKKHYPHLKWVVSFADGTQCGDGTIYRASGFVLTGIKRTLTNQKMPNGDIVSDLGLKLRFRKIAGSMSIAKAKDYYKTQTLPGFQLRYIYFLDKSCRQLLTVPEIPFSKIDEMGAGMYLGKPKRDKQAIGSDQEHSGGAAPTVTLHNNKEK